MKHLTFDNISNISTFLRKYAAPSALNPPPWPMMALRMMVLQPLLRRTEPGQLERCRKRRRARWQRETWISKLVHAGLISWFNFSFTTVDGRHPANQSRSSLHRYLQGFYIYISGGAGFLPSTVGGVFSKDKITPFADEMIQFDEHIFKWSHNLSFHNWIFLGGVA